MKKILVIVYLLIQTNSECFAKVGDRFNCFWIDSINANILDENKFKSFSDEVASKLVLVTILKNNKASFEHDFDKSIVPFTKFNDASKSDLRYSGTNVGHGGYLLHHELRKIKNEKNKYILFGTSVGTLNKNIGITKWKCTKLSN